MPRHGQRGFSLVEMLVAMTVLLVVMSGAMTILVRNARINKAEQMGADVQANARTCLSLVVQKLRSAGWDPMNSGLAAVGLDPDTTDDIDQIEVFADLDLNGTTTGNGEQVLIRHRQGLVEWRPSSDVTQLFEIVARNISNDSDGDGTPEPMFRPDSLVNPTRITVRVTAQSPAVDPVTRQFIRYTVESEVVLRKLL